MPFYVDFGLYAPKSTVKSTLVRSLPRVDCRPKSKTIRLDRWSRNLRRTSTMSHISRRWTALAGPNNLPWVYRRLDFFSRSSTGKIEFYWNRHTEADSTIIFPRKTYSSRLPLGRACAVQQAYQRPANGPASRTLASYPVIPGVLHVIRMRGWRYCTMTGHGSSYARDLSILRYYYPIPVTLYRRSSTRPP